jgi:hypothetical protein
VVTISSWLAELLLRHARGRIAWHNSGFGISHHLSYLRDLLTISLKENYEHLFHGTAHYLSLGHLIQHILTGNVIALVAWSSGVVNRLFQPLTPEFVQTNLIARVIITRDRERNSLWSPQAVELSVVFSS